MLIKDKSYQHLSSTISWCGLGFILKTLCTRCQSGFNRLRSAKIHSFWTLSHCHKAENQPFIVTSTTAGCERWAQRAKVAGNCVAVKTSYAYPRPVRLTVSAKEVQRWMPLPAGDLKNKCHCNFAAFFSRVGCWLT